MQKNGFLSRHKLLLNFLTVTISVITLMGCNVTSPIIEELSPSPSPSPTKTTQKTTPARVTPTNPPKQTPTPTPTDKIQVTGEELKGTQIELWHIWHGETGRVMGELVREFSQTNEWGIQVFARDVGSLDDMDQKVRESLKSDDIPDVVVGYLYQALAWDAIHEVVDLNPYVNDSEWGWSEAEQADFYPAFWEHDRTEKRRLGIPAMRSAQFLFYNLTWAKELGFNQPPVTSKEFKTQACAAAQEKKQDDDVKNDATGGWILSTDYSAALGWLYAYGSRVVRSDGSGYEFNTGQVESAMIFLKDLIDSGCAWESSAESPANAFATRQGLFSTGSLTDFPEQERTFQLAGGQDQWTPIPFPSPSNKPAINVYGPSFEIFSTTPERQLAAWVFLKWLGSSENQARLVQASGSFPLRQSTINFLENKMSAQWRDAAASLAYAQPEPPLQSWYLVRWAVSDAAIQLSRYYFTISEVPSLARLLNSTATDLHTGREPALTPANEGE